MLGAAEEPSRHSESDSFRQHVFSVHEEHVNGHFVSLYAFEMFSVSPVPELQS